ncbi:MAG: hypothetical protein AAGC88_07555 [Bacteroidota bacterium]
MNNDFVYILLVACVLTCCKSAVDTFHSNYSDPTLVDLELLAKQKLGEGFESASRLHRILLWNNVLQGQVVFFVYDANTKKVIYEETNSVRSVSWQSDEQIMIRPFGRIPSQSVAHQPYYANIVSGERVQMKGFKK